MSRNGATYEDDFLEFEEALAAGLKDAPDRPLAYASRESRPQKRVSTPYANCPCWLMREIERTKTWRAQNLILAAHGLMRKRNRKSIMLSTKVWHACGISGEMTRRSAILQLRKLPHIMLITSERRHSGHYRLTKGEMWDHPPPEPEDED